MSNKNVDQEILGTQARQSETMSKQDWETLVRDYEAAKAQREPKTPKAETIHKAETAASRQVSMMYEQGIPELPPAVQARWDAWCDARIKAMVEPALGMQADFLGDEFGKFDARMDKLRADLKQLAGTIGTRVGKTHREFADEIANLKKDNLKLRKEISLLKKSNQRSANVVDLPNPIQRRS